MRASYRRTWLNSLGAEWRNEVQLGRTNSLLSELYQPLTLDGLIFVATRVELARQPTDVYEGNRRIARFDVTTGRAAFDVGSQFASVGEARVGVAHGFGDAKLSIGTTDFGQDLRRVRQGAYTARLFVDQLTACPSRSGLTARPSLAPRPGLGGQDKYTNGFAGADAAHSFSDHTFLVGGLVGGRHGSDPLPTYDLRSAGRSAGRIPRGRLIGERIQFGDSFITRSSRARRSSKASMRASRSRGRLVPLVPGSPPG